MSGAVAIEMTGGHPDKIAATHQYKSLPPARTKQEESGVRLPIVGPIETTASGHTNNDCKARAPVLPPVLADRPCSLDAMPKERRQLYVNVPCCGGRGCPQCSLMSLGFR